MNRSRRHHTPQVPWVGRKAPVVPFPSPPPCWERLFHHDPVGYSYWNHRCRDLRFQGKEKHKSSRNSNKSPHSISYPCRKQKISHQWERKLFFPTAFGYLWTSAMEKSPRFQLETPLCKRSIFSNQLSSNQRVEVLFLQLWSPNSGYQRETCRFAHVRFIQIVPGIELKKVQIWSNRVNLFELWVVFCTSARGLSRFVSNHVSNHRWTKQRPLETKAEWEDPQAAALMPFTSSTLSWINSWEVRVIYRYRITHTVM